MKKVMLSLFFTFSMITANAANFHSVGSNAGICTYSFDGHYYLILSFKDDDTKRLTDMTVVKFKLNDGSVIRLEGYEGSRQISSNSFYWGVGISSSFTDDKHFAIFEITREQIEKLKEGIDKVAINTIPEAYKRQKWNGKSKLGTELYQEFINMKDDFDE